MTEVDGERGVVYLNDVFYVPGAEHGLFLPCLAAEQGFDFTFDHDTLNYRIEYEGRTVIVASPYEATWGFFVTHPENEDLELPRDRSLYNTFSPTLVTTSLATKFNLAGSSGVN